MIEVRLEGRIAGVLASDSRDTGRMSFTFFCPGCGRLWGRISRGAGWYVISRLCEDEASRSEIPGSFFQHYDWWPGSEFGAGEPGLMKFLALHPRLRAHEFRVHMRWAEQFINAAEPHKEAA